MDNHRESSLKHAPLRTFCRKCTEEAYLMDTSHILGRWHHERHSYAKQSHVPQLAVQTASLSFLSQLTNSSLFAYWLGVCPSLLLQLVIDGVS